LAEEDLVFLNERTATTFELAETCKKEWRRVQLRVVLFKNWLVFAGVRH